MRDIWSVNNTVYFEVDMLSDLQLIWGKKEMQSWYTDWTFVIVTRWPLFSFSKCTPSKPKPLVKLVKPLKEIEKPGQFQMDVVNHH